MSTGPPCKDGNAGFTTVPLKALSDQIQLRMHVNSSVIRDFS